MGGHTCPTHKRAGKGEETQPTDRRKVNKCAASSIPYLGNQAKAARGGDSPNSHTVTTGHSIHRRPRASITMTGIPKANRPGHWAPTAHRSLRPHSSVRQPSRSIPETHTNESQYLYLKRERERERERERMITVAIQRRGCNPRPIRTLQKVGKAITVHHQHHHHHRTYLSDAVSPSASDGILQFF